ECNEHPVLNGRIRYFARCRARLKRRARPSRDRAGRNTPPRAAVQRTITGVVLGVVVPLPSSPLGLLPQQYAPPVVVTPQALKYPAMTEAKLSPPDTATGVVLALSMPPSPRRPQKFQPQQSAACAVATTPANDYI